jgi:hypothetical protein
MSNSTFDQPSNVRILPLSVGIEVIRYIDRFRFLVLLATGGAFLLVYRGSPGYGGLAVVTAVSFAFALDPIVRRRERLQMPGKDYLGWQIALCVALLVLEAAADRRSVFIAVLFPVDGYAVGTIALVSYVGMFRGSHRWGYVLVGLSTLVEVGSAIGHQLGTTTGTYLVERCGSWVLTLALMRYIAATLTRLCEDEGLLAAEQEVSKRAIHLHNHALQVLVMADGWVRDWKVLGEWAGLEATRLSDLAAGREEPPQEDLAAALLKAIVEQRTNKLLEADLDTKGLGARPLPVEVVSALVESTHEALNNVARHAYGERASVLAEGGAEGVVVTIRNESARVAVSPRSGFGGFGIKASMIGSMATIGGTAVRATTATGGSEVRLSWFPRLEKLSSTDEDVVADAPTARLMPQTALWRLLASLLVLRLFITTLCFGVSLGSSPVPDALVPLLVLVAVLWVVTLVVLALARSWQPSTWRYVPLICKIDLIIAVSVWLINAVVIPHGTLLSFFQDSFSMYGSFSAAIYPFLMGRRFGRAAWVVLLTVTVIAPFINGYGFSGFVVWKIAERIIYTTVALYMASRIADLSIKGLTFERALRSARARNAYLAQVTRRLLTPLQAIAADSEGTADVRAQARRASAWGYRLLSSNGRISAFEESLEALVDATGSELRGRLTNDPSGSIATTLTVAVATTLSACSDHPAVVTVSDSELGIRVAVVHATGPGPPAAAVNAVRIVVARVGGRVNEPTLFVEGGGCLILWVPRDFPIRTAAGPADVAVAADIQAPGPC